MGGKPSKPKLPPLRDPDCIFGFCTFDKSTTEGASLKRLVQLCGFDGKETLARDAYDCVRTHDTGENKEAAEYVVRVMDGARRVCGYDEQHWNVVGMGDFQAYMPGTNRFLRSNIQTPRTFSSDDFSGSPSHAVVFLLIGSILTVLVGSVVYWLKQRRPARFYAYDKHELDY